MGILLLGALWVVGTAIAARAQLDDVRAELPQLRSAVVNGDVSRADRLGAQIAHQAHTAHSLTSGPAWWLAANIPTVGSPLETGRTIATQADVIGSKSLPGLLKITASVAHSSRVSHSAINLASVAGVAPRLQAAATAARHAQLAVEAAPSSWLPYVAMARRSVATQLATLDGELTGADRAVRLIVPMLGAQGPRTYFVGILNEAEARGGGGIPGAYAIATADHGHITFDHFGTDDDLRGVRADVDLGADFAAQYRQDDPTGYFQNSNVSPDFRDAAQIWAAMWQKKTGQHIDGALAIDPTALSYLLKVTGPTVSADGTRITANNVVALTQSTQYAKYPAYTPRDKAQRKAYLTSLAKSVSKHLTKGGNVARLARAFSDAAQQRRFLVWSRDASLEKQLEQAGWAGVLAAPKGTPYSGFVVTNGSGTKLDYYLRRSTTYSRQGCNRGARAQATFTLTEDAPRSGLPAYVTTRLDVSGKHAVPGSELVLVTYYATPGAHITSVRVDNKPVRVTVGQEEGLVTVTTSLQLTPQATHRVTVAVTEPAATTRAYQLNQPGVHPMRISVSEPAC